MTDYYNLFKKYCPIIYFHKDEPYMPADMNAILKIANVTPEDITHGNNNKIVNIPKAKRFDAPIGKQILCKTDGVFSVGQHTYIDLVYIITFTWNGTLDEHAFDKEEIIIRLKRLEDEYQIDRVFGSSHGNGMWFRVYKNEVELHETHPVIYSANESHAMYNKPRTYKRIFGFGNDITGKHIKWIPQEYVIFQKNAFPEFEEHVKLYDNNGLVIDTGLDYFKTKTHFGNEKNHQPWPGSIQYETVSMDGFYKYQGGIDNLFTGPLKKIKQYMRRIVVVIGLAFWLYFVGYLIFNDILNYKKKQFNKTILLLYVILRLFIVGVLFITGTYLGLELFVLNPISAA